MYNVNENKVRIVSDVIDSVAPSKKQWYLSAVNLYKQDC